MSDFSSNWLPGVVTGEGIVVLVKLGVRDRGCVENGWIQHLQTLMKSHQKKLPCAAG